MNRKGLLGNRIVALLMAFILLFGNSVGVFAEEVVAIVHEEGVESNEVSMESVSLGSDEGLSQVEQKLLPIEVSVRGTYQVVKVDENPEGIEKIDLNSLEQVEVSVGDTVNFFIDEKESNKSVITVTEDDLEVVLEGTSYEVKETTKGFKLYYEEVVVEETSEEVQELVEEAQEVTEEVQEVTEEVIEDTEAGKGIDESINGVIEEKVVNEEPLEKKTEKVEDIKNKTTSIVENQPVAGELMIAEPGEFGLAYIIDENAPKSSVSLKGAGEITGGTVEIRKGTQYPYKGWSTFRYSVTQGSNVKTAFCAQASKASPGGMTLSVNEMSLPEVSNFYLQQQRIRFVKTILLTTEGSTAYGNKSISDWYVEASRQQGFPNVYTFSHAALSHFFANDNKNLSQGNINFFDGIMAPLLSTWYASNISGIKTAIDKGTTFYMASPVGGFSSAYQTILWIERIEYGSIQIKKVSSDGSFSSKNSCYSLEGAEYGAYTNSSCTGTPIATFRTNSLGISEKKEVPSGKYYIKETKPPKGYFLDKTIKTAVVGTGVVTVNVSDIPKSDPVSLLLKKIDSETKSSTAQGGGSLEGAEFTIWYYKGLYTKAQLNGTPLESTWSRYWKLKTDKDGFLSLDDTHYVGGNAFYRDYKGDATLPIGTLWIRETKAPIGYKIPTDRDWIVQIKEGGASYTGVFFSETKAEEPVIKGGVKVAKIDDTLIKAQGLGSLKDAEFSIYSANDNKVRVNGKDYSKNQVVKIIKSNEDGIATTGDKELPYGDYYLKETKAPPNYNLGDESSKFRDFQIRKDGVIVDLTKNPIANPIKTGKIRAKKETKGNPSNMGASTVKDTKIGIYSNNNGLISVNKSADKDPKLAKDYAKGELVDVLTTKENGYSEYSCDLPYGNYIIKEDKNPKGHLLSGDNTTQEIALTQATMTLDGEKSFKNTPIRKDIRILKLDGGDGTVKREDMTVMPNVSFTIEPDPRSISQEEMVNYPAKLTLTTGADGYASSEGLGRDKDGNPEPYFPYGRYLVKEVKDTVPEGKVPIPDFIIIIDENTNINSTVITKEIVNSTGHGSFYIRKLQKGTSTLIKDRQVTFQLLDYYSKSPIFADGTDDGGIFKTRLDYGQTFTIGVPLGKYIVREVDPGKGYIKGSDIEFDIVNDINLGLDSSINYYNDKAYGSITIQKVDKKLAPLQSIGFNLYANEDIVEADNTKVYNAGDKVGGIEYTDISGVAKFENLPPGKYKVEEIYSYTGLVKEEVERVVEVSTHNNLGVYSEVLLNPTILIENTPNELVILKSDEDTNDVLEGVTFNVNGNEYITDSSGEIRIPRLLDGFYTVFETKTVEGYIKDETMKYFIVEDGWMYISDENQNKLLFTKSDNLRLSFVNKKNEISLSKKDVNGVFIEGARLGLFKVLNNNKETLEEVDTWYTEEEPHILKGVKNGNYILRELETPIGYVKSDDVDVSVTDSMVVLKVVNMVDKQVFVSKKSITGTDELPGALLRVEDLQGNLIEKWESTTEKHAVSGLEEGKTYKLIEEISPLGYTKAEEIEFTVTTDKETQHITMVDKQVRLTKKDITGTNEVSGATLTIFDKNKHEVDRWESDGTEHFINGLQVGETYTLEETITPDGYATAETITFTVSPDNTLQQVEMKNKRVSVKKVDTDGNMVIGIEFNVLDKDSNIVDSWFSEDGVHYIKNIKVGETYTLKEVRTSFGYVMAKPVTFTVNDTEDQEIVITNKRVFASKVSVGNASKQLVGATLEVTDDTGKVVDTWESSEEKHSIYNLVAGETYTLTETKAPNGYVIAKSITFTVTDDLQNQEIVMKDKQVTVSKLDDETKLVGVVGATLEILDSSQQVVDTWVSDGQPYNINNLVIGNTYTLIEKETPIGYVKAEPITFKVEDDEISQTLTMYDEQLKVSKKDITGINEVSGAILEIRDAMGIVVDTWTSTDVPHFVNNLEVNKTYTLVEVKAPEGYVKADPIDFTVGGTNPKEIVMLDDTFKVSKQDVTGKKELAGASFEVTDVDGKVVDSWTSTNKPHFVDNLELGKTYTLTEVNPPKNYIKGKPVDFTVGGTNPKEVVIYNKQVGFLKVDIEGKAVVGAELGIFDENDIECDRFITDGTGYFSSKLELGKSYTLKELKAPKGYVKADDVLFTVEDNLENQEITMVDPYVKVGKTLDDSKKLVGGVTFEVRFGNKVLDTWVSEEGKYHRVSNLELNTEYTLVEIDAPNGMTIAEPVKFTPKSNEVVTISMVNKTIRIDKVEKGTKEYLVGSELEIVDSEGKVVDSWKTDGKGYRPKGLVVGKSYTLREKVAPDGYVTAKNIDFVVKNDYKSQVITMEDDFTKIQFEKRDYDTKKLLQGAKLQLQDEKGTVLKEWNSEEKPFLVTKLKTGRYRLHEAKAPNGYNLTEDVVFDVENSGDVKIIIMYDKLKPDTPIATTGDSYSTLYKGISCILIPTLWGLYLFTRKKRIS